MIVFRMQCDDCEAVAPLAGHPEGAPGKAPETAAIRFRTSSEGARLPVS